MNPKTREAAIEMACSHMVLARRLGPKDMARYMAIVAKLTDIEVVQALLGSQILYLHYLETELSLN